jgi:hypothetical protein
MGMLKRVFSVLAMTCALLAGIAVTGAVAQAAQPSLEGEVLLAGPDSGMPTDTSMFEVTLRCGGTAPSWWTYSASGVATGPYPGTFTETGTVYIDADGLGASAPVLTLHAEFAIQSGSTLVTGTRELKMVSSNNGSCLSLADRYDSSFTATTTYDATIQTSSASYADSGTATIDTRRSERFNLDTHTSLGGTSRYRSEFDSAGGTTPTPSSGNVAYGFGLMGSWRSPVLFGFAAKQTENGYRGLCGVFDPSRKTIVVCTSVDSFVATDGNAVITGDAWVNKVKTRYRIQVSDSGRWFGDSFKIETDSGYSTQGSTGLLGGISIR